MKNFYKGGRGLCFYQSVQEAEPRSYKPNHRTKQNTIINSLWSTAYSLLLIFVSMFSLSDAWAQSGRTLSGVVRSAAEGQPLQGVSIRTDQRQTITDKDGRFQIQTSQQEGSLEVKHLGYKTRQIDYGNIDEPIYILLMKVEDPLEEVVVIGYGKTSKRLNTGSVSSIGAKEIVGQPVSNPLATLQGRMPGVLVEQNNGLPGAKFSVQIRGRNSIAQGNNPLFLIDGIPFDVDYSSNFANAVNVNSPFNMINPDDIERIDILKDAEATSIYGSRGANGVVLITTKSANKGKTRISASHHLGFSNVSKFPDMLSPEKFRSLRHEALGNDNLTPSLNNAHDLLVLDTAIINDWGSILIGGTGRKRNSNLNIEGGADKTSFRLSGGLYSEDNVFPGDDGISRASFNSVIQNGGFSDRMQISAGLSYVYGHTAQAATDLTSKINMIPYGFQLIDDVGRLVWDDATLNYGNPFSYLYQKYESNSHRFFPTLKASYRFLDNLSLTLNNGLIYDTYNQTFANPKIALDPRWGLKGSADFTATRNLSWNIEPQIDYKWLIRENLNISFLAGGTWSRKIMENSRIAANDYENDALLGSVKGAGSIVVTDRYSDYRYQGMFARVNFNLGNQFLITASGRRDGSSRFATENRYALFGAVSAGWVFTEGNFFKNLGKNPLSFGKIRASYGTTGNDQIGDYMYLDNYAILGNRYNTLSLEPIQLYNPSFGWEQLRKLDIGLDVAFWDSRLAVKMDFYQNTSDNQLVYYTLPYQTGFASVLRNFPGEVRNQGFEIELTAAPIRAEKLAWNTSINTSLHRNQLLAFPDLEKSAYANRYVIGQPLDIIMGYIYEGVDPQEGAYRVRDTNGDGTINNQDYVPIGHFRPSFYGGFNNSLSIGNFSMDIFLQFVKQNGRHPVYSNSSPFGSGLNVLDIVDDRWRRAGDVAQYAKATTSFNQTRTSYLWASNSDAIITDASFIRLKNINITYSMPSSFCSRLGVNGISFLIQGQNLATITKYSGNDPEVQSLNALPPLRTWNFGMNLIL